ncbi:MAG: hypothetical protein GX432_04580 [Candidatus Atribacteria bacterium]|nr:hypothetical protein [Candidatus Atribacteria bacterium]
MDDVKNNQAIFLLANHFEYGATIIIGIYQDRLQIEKLPQNSQKELKDQDFGWYQLELILYSKWDSSDR